jgi:DNA polymerase-4
VGRSADLPRPAGAGSGAAPADDTGCGVLHVDMDAFYASVEIRHRPELQNRPVIVAGGGTRGVVLSANYLAREYGVRAAMPGAVARRRCPHAVFVPPEFSRYHETSAAVMAVFRSVTPLVEPLSLDEAFLDVSGALRRLGVGAAEVGQRIRARVKAEQGITCSVGVATTKFIAKLAAGLAKPDGLMVVPADGVLDMLHPLPVSALWGVGERTAAQLERLGLHTVGELAATPLPTLRRAVGVAAAEHLAALAAGRDDRAVIPDVAEKSIGAERTFDPAVLHRQLLGLAERTAMSLRHRGMVCRCVAIKVRYADFSTVTRSRTLPVATDVAQHIYRTAIDLFDRLDARPVRLVGVRAEQLDAQDGAAGQLSLGEPEHGRRDAELAADAARGRFGSAAVRPASLLPGGQHAASQPAATTTPPKDQPSGPNVRVVGRASDSYPQG